MRQVVNLGKLDVATLRLIEVRASEHPKERLNNKILNYLVNQYAMHNMGNYREVEWMNQMRIISLN